jgi:hypothetical protein
MAREWHYIEAVETRNGLVVNMVAVSVTGRAWCWYTNATGTRVAGWWSTPFRMRRQPDGRWYREEDEER